MTKTPKKLTTKKATTTPAFLSKKHLNFGQGLEFLKFGQGNRGLNEQNRIDIEENKRNNKDKQRTIDKNFRVRDPYFLLNNFSLNSLAVRVPHNFSRRVCVSQGPNPLVGLVLQ